MNTGSRDERELLNNVDRIARATERIARALEQWQFGATAEEVAATSASLRDDWAKQQEGTPS